MEPGSNRPIIIKRKKVIVAGGHHGGAWKVAYADFVTAMMAFFMLMWLLNATTEQQRKGIADYFSPTIPINRASGGGDGALSGDTVFTSNVQSQSGRGGISHRFGDGIVTTTSQEEAEETAALEDLSGELLGSGGESTLMDNELRQVVTRLTDEGLVIELFDLPSAPLFRDGTSVPSAAAVRIISGISTILAEIENSIAITSHVRKSPSEAVDFWSLTSARANRTRRLFELSGFDPTKVSRITGQSDRVPVTPDATALRNNRLEIIVLRSDAIGRR